MQERSPQSRPGAPTLTERMAAAVAGCRFDALPAEAVAKAKLCVLDYFSCALVSHELPWSLQAIDVASDNSGRNGRADATVIGTAHRVAPHDAAFANAVLGHALVRDDMHVGSVSHLGVVVLPTLLALTEDPRGADARGRDLLTAIVCGYEVGGRIGRSILDVDVAKIFRPTGIAGPIAAAAAAARLLGLDAARTAAAIGLAANTVAGYNEWAATGGSEMFFHTGFAARNALTAAQLAAAGAYVSPSAADGPAGLLSAFGKPTAPDVPEPFDGEPEILSVFFKPVPACNYAQSPAQAARRIAVHDRPTPGDIDRILVRVTRAAAAYPGCDAGGPFEHILQAKMSIQYNVAAALVTGAFDEAGYRPAGQPEICRLAAAATLVVDEALTEAYPRAQGAEVVVLMKDGTEHRCRVPDVAPASEAEVEQRFSAAAAERLGRDKAERLYEFVMTLESSVEATTLARLTHCADLTPATT
ncbi:MAG: MmgE/PrpD family protein [Gammaproteobacteria bacterium]|nr:MmgE/PrpD family protein [Gammaproteobacteria bacterium]